MKRKLWILSFIDSIEWKSYFLQVEVWTLQWLHLELLEKTLHHLWVLFSFLYQVSLSWQRCHSNWLASVAAKYKTSGERHLVSSNITWLSSRYILQCFPLMCLFSGTDSVQSLEIWVNYCYKGLLWKCDCEIWRIIRFKDEMRTQISQVKHLRISSDGYLITSEIQVRYFRIQGNKFPPNSCHYKSDKIMNIQPLSAWSGKFFCPF